MKYFLIAACALFLAFPSAAQAQGYDGLIADEESQQGYGAAPQGEPLGGYDGVVAGDPSLKRARPEDAQEPSLYEFIEDGTGKAAEEKRRQRAQKAVVDERQRRVEETQRNLEQKQLQQQIQSQIAADKAHAEMEKQKLQQQEQQQQYR